MDRVEQEVWREKVRLCAVAIGLYPTSPAGDMGWHVKEYERAVLELHYYPLASDTQAMYLLKSFLLNVQWDGRVVRVNRGEWWNDLNKAVVDYVASHPELRPVMAVRKSVPTR